MEFIGRLPLYLPLLCATAQPLPGSVTKYKPIAMDIRTDGPSESGGLKRLVLRGHLGKCGGSTVVDIKVSQ